MPFTAGHHGNITLVRCANRLCLSCLAEHGPTFLCLQGMQAPLMKYPDRRVYRRQPIPIMVGAVAKKG